MASQLPPTRGDRVVVRFALNEHTAHISDRTRDPAATLSDITGRLIASTDAALTVQRGDDEVVVPTEFIVSVRTLSTRTVRNSDIRSVELAAARGWPGREHEIADGWMLRASSGFTVRGSSAVPVGSEARLDDSSVAAIRSWYAERDLPPWLIEVERLLPVTGAAVSEMLTASIDELTSGHDHTEVTISAQPDERWLTAQLRARPGESSLAAAQDEVESVIGTACFAALGDSIGRGTITEDAHGRPWFGITSLWTDEHARGTGAGRAIVSALTAWAREQGAEHAYIQLDGKKTTQRDWYRGLGYGLHHRFGYRRL
ncbi:GNAT family N-acetyltransferase [Jongsikchunia kroppenstedtii]|uniref:GNAT family N-acetyltransferase n=1 Tax=Jongsikchunia kroppenstedtii TaxID=1121721 RepID=UPI00037A4DF3|nr:GNAT family N-acetyltransferase [Jongsikchunia kroppenstedtii]